MATRATVHVTDHFRQSLDAWERQIQVGLAEGAHIALASIKAQPSQYNLAPIKDKLAVTPVGRHRRGFEVFVIGRDFRTMWFEKGTRRKLGRATGRARAGGNRGVKPQRFMRNGLRAAFPQMRAVMERVIR
jgi:hypothetical protein